MPMYKVEVIANGRINLVIQADSLDDTASFAYAEVDKMFDKTY